MQSKPLVLIVDDDRDILRLLSKWLEIAGYPVVQAINGKQAIEVIQTQCPKILITDWEMPEMDGLELCRWLRQQDLPNYIYTLFLTVRGSSADMIQGLEAGADDFLKKPVDREELLARLRASERVLDLERRLTLLARTDPLTGINSRRAFMERCEQEVSRSLRHRCPLSCVIIDLDFFKRINDTHGHPVGDEALRRTAALLSSQVRASDIVGRYGGEEFCVLLAETAEAGAHLWAERFRTQLAKLEIRTSGAPISITASFGVAQCMEDTTTSEALIDNADQALLVAKRSGRDRVVTFSSLTGPATESTTDYNPESMFERLKARDVMNTIVAALNQREDVGAAMNHFLRFRINSAPVVDSAGKLVGVISEKDLAGIMLRPMWWTMPIKDVMKTNVVWYEEDSCALAIYQFLTRVTIRSVIIVRDGKPTGVISRSGLLRWFANSVVITEGNNAPNLLDVPSFPTAAPSDPRLQLKTTAAALVTETNRLNGSLADAHADLVPCVVGGVSRLQEMINDLLAYSRFIQDDSAAQPEFSDASAESAGLQQGLGSLLAHLGGSGDDWSELLTTARDENHLPAAGRLG
jgi:diguanylate cyclase (GGDEF)-like protein